MNKQYESDEDRFSEYETRGLWEYIGEVLEYPELLNDYGFAVRSAVKENIIVLVVGDRLDPTEGLDYLGPDWEQLSCRKYSHLLTRRENAVNKIQSSVLRALVDAGYKAACDLAERISIYQTVYLCRSIEETQDTLRVLFNIGVGVHEFSGGVSERAGDDLVYVFREHYSYYIKD